MSKIDLGSHLGDGERGWRLRSSTRRAMLLLYSFYVMSFHFRFFGGNKSGPFIPLCTAPSTLLQQFCKLQDQRLGWRWGGGGVSLPVGMLPVCSLPCNATCWWRWGKREECGFPIEVGQHLPGRSQRMNYVAICIMRWLYTLQHLLWKVFVWHSLVRWGHCDWQKCPVWSTQRLLLGIHISFHCGHLCQ